MFRLKPLNVPDLSWKLFCSTLVRIFCFHHLKGDIRWTRSHPLTSEQFQLWIRTRLRHRIRLKTDSLTFQRVDLTSGSSNFNWLTGVQLHTESCSDQNQNSPHWFAQTIDQKSAPAPEPQQICSDPTADGPFKRILIRSDQTPIRFSSGTDRWRLSAFNELKSTLNLLTWVDRQLNSAAKDNLIVASRHTVTDSWQKTSQLNPDGDFGLV